jgi:hypothetical protein
VSFAQQLERKLVAVQSEIVELEQEDYIRFSFELLKIVADSQGDGEIVHQFFDRHLAYLNVDLLTVFSQSIEALLEREKNRYWQADIASVLHNLAIDLQTYPRGDRSINFALSIACKERSLLVRTQPDEQILQGRGCTKDRSKTEIFEADRDRQTAYFELVQELIQCPLNDEDRILTTRPELVDKGLVIALLEVADIRKEHNHPDSASTIEWLESFADKLNQKLELQIETNQQPDDPRFEDFLLDLLQTVDRSQGNRQIVHQFLDEHLAYLSNNLLTILPQSIEALLSRQKDPDRQADLGSILDNLAIDLQTYSSGDRSINLALSIACKEGALLCRSQLDESRERGTTEIIEADIDRQTAYLNLVQLLIQCPLNDEDRVLASYPELVDKRLVTALLEVAETSKKHNNPDAASTIEWLESFAEQLDLKLDLQQDPN